MKKFLLILLGVLTALPTFAVDFSYTYEGQTLKYTIIDEEAKTCKTKDGSSGNSAGNSVSGTLVIPSIVTYNDTEYTVVEIGYNGFYGRSYLTFVSLPETITSIGNNAFFRCTGLTQITIPEGVTSIGRSAFSGCTGLTQVTIPESVTLIDVYTFYGCTGLSEITIPRNVTSINSSAFYNCSGLHVIFSEGTTHIPDKAFQSCTGLTQITIPEGVTKIGQYAFDGCTGLTQITIPESVTSIGNYAFRDCTGLKIIHIANPSIAVNYTSRFNNCKNISDIYLDFPNPEQFSEKINLISTTAKLHVLPSDYLSVITSDWEYKDRVAKGPFICDGIHYDWVDTEENTVKITGFDSDTETVTFNESVNGYSIVAFECVMSTYPSIKHIIYNRPEVPADFCKDMTSLEHVEFGPQVTTIGDNAFAGAVGLKTLTSPAVIPPALGENVFDVLDIKPQLYVSSESFTAYIEDERWPEYFTIYRTDKDTNNDGWGYDIVKTYSDSFDVSLTAIPESIGGDELTIPATIEVNGRTARVVDVNITSLPTGAKFTSLRIEDSELPLSQGCDLSKLLTATKVYIGRNIQAADGFEEALYGYNRLTDVTFGNAVTKIPAKMFMGATRIPRIDLSETKIVSIGDMAFHKVSLLTDIKWPSKLKYIGKQAFVGVRLTTLDFPESITEIDDQAFYTCNNLTSVVINHPIQRIGNGTFASCSKLKNVTFNAAIGTIDSNAFADLTLDSLDVIANTIKSNAFANVKITGSKPLTISAPVIEAEAFRNVSVTDVNLVTNIIVADVFNKEASEQFKTIFITGEEITGNPFGTVQLNTVDLFHLNVTGDIPKETFKNLVLAENADIEIKANTINTSAFSGMTALFFNKFVINALGTIDSYAFGSLTATTESEERAIEISAKQINSSAFSLNNNTNSKFTAIINASSIKSYAFNRSKALKNIYVTADDMESRAFVQGSNIEYANLNIPTVNSLFDTKFTAQLKTLELGENVKKISGGAFEHSMTGKYHPYLRTIKFNNCQLTEIGACAFACCPVDTLIFPTIEGAEPTCVIRSKAFAISHDDLYSYREFKYIDLGNTVKSVENRGLESYKTPNIVKLGSVEILNNGWTNAYPDVLVVPGTVKQMGTSSATAKHIIFEHSEAPLSVNLKADNSTLFEFNREVNATWTGTAKKAVTTDNAEHKFNVQLCAADSVYLGASVATATFKVDCAPTSLAISDYVEGIAVADGATLTVPDVDLHIPASMKLLSGEFTMPADFKLNLADGNADNVLDLKTLKFTADENSRPELYCGRNIALDGYSLGRINTWKTAVFGDNVTAIAEHCFDGCADLTTAVINPSIKSVGNSAFKDCTSLGTIEFSESLETIDAAAYSGCTSIEKVVARGTVPPGGVFAFDDEIAEVTPLYVPEGSEFDYGDSDNFIMFDIFENIHTLADGGIIKDMEVDESEEPVDDKFTAGSRHHLPSLFDIIRHLYQKITGHGAPAARVAAYAARAEQSSNDDLLWISSDPRVASIDNNGYVTFHTADPVNITAVATDGSGARLTLELNKYTLGDIDKSGSVNIMDVNSMISGFLTPEDTKLSLKIADMNGDGNIDLLDINILISNILNEK